MPKPGGGNAANRAPQPARGEVQPAPRPGVAARPSDAEREIASILSDASRAGLPAQDTSDDLGQTLKRREAYKQEAQGTLYDFGRGGAEPTEN